MAGVERYMGHSKKKKKWGVFFLVGRAFCAWVGDFFFFFFGLGGVGLGGKSLRVGMERLKHEEKRYCFGGEKEEGVLFV